MITTGTKSPLPGNVQDLAKILNFSVRRTSRELAILTIFFPETGNKPTISIIINSIKKMIIHNKSSLTFERVCVRMKHEAVGVAPCFLFRCSRLALSG